MARLAGSTKKRHGGKRQYGLYDMAQTRGWNTENALAWGSCLVPWHSESCCHGNNWKLFTLIWLFMASLLSRTNDEQLQNACVSHVVLFLWNKFKVEAQWPIGYGVGLRIKRSLVRIRPWPLRWVLGQGSLLPLSQGEAFTLASISYLAILVKYIYWLAGKKVSCVRHAVLDVQFQPTSVWPHEGL